MTPAAPSVADAFRQQIAWCLGEHGAPFTADLLAALLRDFEAGGGWRRLLGGWPADPLLDGTALRAAGAVHRLGLMGVEPFAGLFARLERGPAALDQAVRLAGARAEVASWLRNPPQTNEVMRSAVFLGGFFEIVRAQGLALDLREIGCSGGLNLNFDRYRYRLGDTDWGPADSPVRLAPRWTGPSPRGVAVEVASRRGADQLPVDLSDREARLRLLSYIWADQADRVARVRGALDLATADPPIVNQGDAADWVEAELAQLADGRTTVLYHSFVWHYLPHPAQQRIRAALARAGETATGRRGLAWLSYEGDGDVETPALKLTLWPGGETRTLARGHPHGRWVEWLGE
ncbi:MAG: hypothetical protein JWM33_267 [Caulobacteraceae bacterium]|nr:hypothetical protein [Caulobacteraceae bacterium]